MADNRLSRFTMFMAGLCLLAAVALPLPTWILTPLLVIALGFAPGWCVVAWLRPELELRFGVVVSLVLSPFLLGAGASALNVTTGIDLSVAARLLLLGTAIGSAWASLRGWVGFGGDRQPWMPALLWAGGVAALLLANTFLPPRADGWFHAAVTGQISLQGLPPEDPYFAGIPLLYFWGYHAWAALWLALDSTAAVWTPLITFNVLSAAAVMLAAMEMARKLGGGARAQWWAAGVTALGYAPFSWLLLLLRLMVGDVTGVDELRRVVMFGVEPIAQTMSGWMLHSSMVFFGDKFLVLTPFSLGLALTMALIIVLLDYLDRPRWATGALLLLLQATALFIHTFIGFSTGLIGAVTWAWVALRGRPRSWAMLAGLAAAFVGATLLMAPYLTGILAGKRGLLHVGLSRDAFITLVQGGLLVVPLGVVWLWSRKSSLAAQVLLLLAALMGFAAVTMGLPEENQSKFFNLLFLILAPAAGLALHDWDTRLQGAARWALRSGLAMAVLPTAALLVWGNASERAQSGLTWHEPTPAEGEALSWVRSNTRANVVFVDLSGASDLLALTGRSVLWGGPLGERVVMAGAEEALEVRRVAARELDAGEGLSPATRELLGEMGRDVWVFVRRSAGDFARLEGKPGYVNQFENEGVRIYLATELSPGYWR